MTPAPWILCTSLDAEINALLGMQPTLRQTPLKWRPFDDRDLLAELAESNRTDVAGRAGTDDDGIELSHVASPVVRARGRAW